MTFLSTSPALTANSVDLNEDSVTMKEATDLTESGRYKYYEHYVPQVRSWRYRDRNSVRLTRRSTLMHSDDNWYRESEMRSYDWKKLIVDGYFLFLCGPPWRKQPPFGFPMLTGLRRFFQTLVRNYPVVSVCMWLILFICEAAIVTLYIIQTTRAAEVSWVEYDEVNFSWFSTAQTILSIALLSQLVFAYSVAPFTIIVVLVTSGYQIISYFVALVSRLGWVSRLYVPLFLRCWPMRQYFLFLLDSSAMLIPRNHRLDVVRLAARPLSLFVVLTFTFGCVFHIHQVFRGFDINIGVAMYWMMVTVSTIGFGDVVPHGLDGRAIAMVIILIYLAMMPSWIMLILQSMRILKEYPKYTGRSRHFFVYGHISREDAISILEEVFELYPMKVVCFCYSSFSPDVLAIGRHPRYRLRCHFLQVKVLDRLTLQRMRVQEASGIIVLPGDDDYSSILADADVMLWSVLFQRHAPNVPQYLRLRFAFYAKLLRGNGKYIIDQANKFLMSTALLLPGVLPFLVNLIRISFSASSTSAPSVSSHHENRNVIPHNIWDEGQINNWKYLYEYSRNNSFATCVVPQFFVHVPLSKVIRIMKSYNILVIGVEENSRKLMRLDLDYYLETDDILLLLYERGKESIEDIISHLSPYDPNAVPYGHPSYDKDKPNNNDNNNNNDDNNNNSNDNNNNYIHHEGGGRRGGIPSSSLYKRASANISKQDLFELEVERNFTDIPDDNNNNNLYYPFNASFDLAVDDKRDEKAANNPRERRSLCAFPDNMNMSGSGSGRKRRKSHEEKIGTGISSANSQLHDKYIKELREQLMQESFVNKRPGNVSIEELPLGGSLYVLRDLLNYHRAAEEGNQDVEESVERLEQQINDILEHVASEFLSGIGKSNSVEHFLFIDQVTSFHEPPRSSIYGKFLEEAISHYELIQMMQSIECIYTKSRFTLLTSRKLSHDFLSWWSMTFGYPLRYIRGLSTMESHLDYALQQSGGVSRLRGILLYCSQLGSWDYSDIPLITVENSVRRLLETNTEHNKRREEEEERREGEGVAKNKITASPTMRTEEQHIVVELKSFSSCISVTPHHTDPEWRRRGEEHFQYSLPFMTGHCFSANMMYTLFIHAHRDHRIMQFFEMVLCLHKSNDLYDVTLWSSRKRSSPTLFNFCGNHLLHFQTFGDAFSYLLSKRMWVAIGVFRQFPASENLPGVPRYFVTNPPLEMPLRADDVIYAISASSSSYNATDN